MKMRRLAVWLLLLCLLLTACAAPVEQSATTTTTTTTATTAIVTTESTTTTAETTTSTAAPTTTSTRKQVTTTRPPVKTTVTQAATTTAVTTTVRTTTTDYTTGTIGKTIYRRQEPPKGTSTPIMYKVTGDDGQLLWLFGSVHVGIEKMYPLPEYVQTAFDSADALAVEFDILAYEKDIAAQVGTLQAFRLPEGWVITDCIDANTYNRARAILEDNDLYVSEMDYYEPILWSQFIDGLVDDKTLPLINASADLGVDRALLTAAKERNMPIVDIESAQSQTEMLASFSYTLQKQILLSSISSYNRKPTGNELLHTIDLWSEGGVLAMEDYLFGGDSYGDWRTQQLNKEYMDKMIHERNNAMANYARKALESKQEVFLCVGLGHIIGETGLATQLKDYGYTVQLVVEFN